MVNYVEYLRTKFEPITDEYLEKVRESGEITKLSAISKLLVMAEERNILTTSREVEDYLIVLLCDGRINIEKSGGVYRISAV